MKNGLQKVKEKKNRLTKRIVISDEEPSDRAGPKQKLHIWKKKRAIYRMWIQCDSCSTVEMLADWVAV